MEETIEIASQNNNFLQDYIATPIESTIAIATVMTKSNPKLAFITVIIYFFFTLVLSFITDILNFDENLFSSLFISILSITIIIILSISNIIYFGKTIQKSDTLKQLILNIQSTTLKDFYFKWFSIASGHLLSILVLFLLMTPFYFLMEVHKFFIMPAIILLLLFLYTQILIINLVISSSNIKEGFYAMFQIFKLSFLKTSFNKTYLIFIVVGGFLINIISKVSDFPAKLISSNEESLSFIFTDALFIALFTFFVSILSTAIASSLSAQIVKPKTIIVSEK